MPRDEQGDKWACEPCVRGHRSSKCEHFERIMIRVKKPGRPLTSCPHPPGSCSCKLDRVMMVRISTGNECRCAPKYAVAPDGSRHPFPKQEDASSASSPAPQHADDFPIMSQAVHSPGSSSPAASLAPSTEPSINGWQQQPHSTPSGRPARQGSVTSSNDDISSDGFGLMGVPQGGNAMSPLADFASPVYGVSFGAPIVSTPGQAKTSIPNGGFLGRPAMNFGPQNHNMWPVSTNGFSNNYSSRQQFSTAQIPAPMQEPRHNGTSPMYSNAHGGNQGHGYHNGYGGGNMNGHVAAHKSTIHLSHNPHTCNCGPTCTCFACPDHPYNTTTVPRVQMMASILERDLSSDHSPSSMQDSSPEQQQNGIHMMGQVPAYGGTHRGMQPHQSVQPHQNGSRQNSIPTTHALVDSMPMFDNSNYLQFEFPLEFDDSSFLDIASADSITELDGAKSDSLGKKEKGACCQ